MTEVAEPYAVARFWAKVEVRRPGECWPWLASTNEHGYGVFRLPKPRDGRLVKAHRFAFAQFHARDPFELGTLLHSCDNPPCCNPEHLHEGTQLDNIRDMVRKGRQKGSRHSRLSSEDVRAIRASTETRVSLARRFGVSPAYISLIVHGARWRDEGEN